MQPINLEEFLLSKNLNRVVMKESYFPRKPQEWIALLKKDCLPPNFISLLRSLYPQRFLCCKIKGEVMGYFAFCIFQSSMERSDYLCG